MDIVVMVFSKSPLRNIHFAILLDDTYRLDYHLPYNVYDGMSGECILNKDDKFDFADDTMIERLQMLSEEQMLWRDAT